MKSKTILLSALFIGFITMEKVGAVTHSHSHCPQTVDYTQYTQVSVPGTELDHCTLEHTHGGFQPRAGDTFTFASDLAHREDVCPYRLDQHFPTDYAQFSLRCTKGG